MKTKQIIFIILSIFTISTPVLATSPDYVATIHNLMVHEKVIYAEVQYTHPYLDSEIGYFFSRDGGTNWGRVDSELPFSVVQQLEKRQQLPITLCLPKTQTTCYQTGNESILESNDGGKTWLSSWTIPDGRREFLRRKSSGEFNLGPFDIVHLELDNKQIIIAALGTEGLIIKTDNDEWRSVGLSGAGPMYFNAKSFTEAKNTLLGELFILCIITFIFFFINLFIYIKNRKTLGYYLIFFLPLAYFGIAIVFYFLFYENPLVVEVILLTIFVLMFIFICSYQFFTNTSRWAKVNLVPIVIIPLASYSLFIFWAYGTIPVHETALWIALSLHILLLLWILYLPIKELLQTKMSRSKRDLHE